MRSGIMQPVDRGRLYSDAELCKALTFCAEHEHESYWRDKCFLVRFVLGLGLRVSEIVPLRIPEDCGMDGFISVRRSKTGRQRIVKVSPELKSYYITRVQRLMREGEGKLFPGVTSKRTLERWVDLVMDGAGVEKVQGRGIHGLRHSFCTFEIASRRLDWHEAALALGHSTPVTTQAVYAHALTEYMFEPDENRIPKWREIALAPQKLRAVERRTA